MRGHFVKIGSALVRVIGDAQPGTPGTAGTSKSARRTARTKEALRHRDGDTCWWCDCAFTQDRPSTIDHVMPRTHGGSDHLDNLVLACRPCNLAKGADLPDEWEERLLEAGGCTPPKRRTA
jgi:hypothetical protein